MKNLVVCLGMITVVFFTIVSIAALNINTTKQLDLNNATRMAAYETIEQLYSTNITETNKPGEFVVIRDSKNTELENDNNLKMAFNKNLVRQLKSNDKVTVKILGISAETGLISVNVSTTYNNMGIERTIETTQTVIRESIVNAE